MRNQPIPIALMIAAFLSGCCTSRHCIAPSNTERKYSFNPVKNDEDRRRFQAAIKTGAGVQAERADMLVLSGGGSHGAWGAGVLRGWSENTNAPRPKFRVVTGVSTGALLATYAFLGEPQDDETLHTAYTKVQTKDIYRNKCPLLAVFSDSFKSAKPLKHTIDNYIDMKTLERVALAAGDHRGLYVGTANMDTGKLVIWDLTKLAADQSNPNRLELYRNIVYASASIPIAVPPVNIDGNLYSDGGVRSQLFFEKHFGRGNKELMRELKSSEQHLTIHVIVNGQVGVPKDCVCDCLTDTGLKKGLLPRTLAMLLDANMNGDLYRVDDFRRQIPGATSRMCWIPEDYPNLYDSADFFPDQMSALYEAGRAFGRTNDTWHTEIPLP